MTRDEMTALLEMKSNYSYEYLQSLTREQLEKLYREKVES